MVTCVSPRRNETGALEAGGCPIAIFVYPRVEELDFSGRPRRHTASYNQREVMASRLIRVRYSGTCAGCSSAVIAGSQAWRDAEAKTIVGRRAAPLTLR